MGLLVTMQLSTEAFPNWWSPDIPPKAFILIIGAGRKGSENLETPYEIGIDRHMEHSDNVQCCLGFVDLS